VRYASGMRCVLGFYRGGAKANVTNAVLARTVWGPAHPVLGGVEVAAELPEASENAVVFLETDLRMAHSSRQGIPSAVAIAGVFFAETGGVFGRSGLCDDAFKRSLRSAAPLARTDAPLPQPAAEFAPRCAVNCLDSPVRRVGS
jgi:hypothetical protein